MKHTPLGLVSATLRRVLRAALAAPRQVLPRHRLRMRALMNSALCVAMVHVVTAALAGGALAEERYLKIGGGVTGDRQYLSVTEQCGQVRPDLRRSGASGFEQQFELQSLGEDVYLIAVVKKDASCPNRYLGASARCETTSVFMDSSDDGSGRQRWFGRRDAGSNTIVFENVSRSQNCKGGASILSVDDDGSVVDLWSIDDGSGRQKWQTIASAGGRAPPVQAAPPLPGSPGGPPLTLGRGDRPTQFIHVPPTLIFVVPPGTRITSTEGPPCPAGVGPLGSILSPNRKECHPLGTKACERGGFCPVDTVCDLSQIACLALQSPRLCASPPFNAGAQCSPGRTCTGPDPKKPCVK